MFHFYFPHRYHFLVLLVPILGPVVVMGLALVEVVVVTDVVVTEVVVVVVTKVVPVVVRGSGVSLVD